MVMTQEIIEQITRRVLQELKQEDENMVQVGVSNRHIHLSRADMDVLFGAGSELKPFKSVKQPGQYAAEETVTLRGPKGELQRVRVLGPLRKETQVEISVSDGFALGLSAPVRLSGHLEGTPGLEITGPCGTIRIERGVIVALRHIHMLPETAQKLGLKDGEVVDVEVSGERGGVMGNVLIRAVPNSAYEMHIDVEEANAFGLKNNQYVRIRKKGEK